MKAQDLCDSLNELCDRLPRVATTLFVMHTRFYGSEMDVHGPCDGLNWTFTLRSLPILFHRISQQEISVAELIGAMCTEKGKFVVMEVGRDGKALFKVESH